MKKNNHIEQKIMAQIHSQELKMRPRWYFILGSVAMIAGLVSVFIVVIFLFNLQFFLLRQHGLMGQWRFEQLLATFPLWLPMLAAGSLTLGVVLLKKYDFSYQKNFRLIIVALLGAALVAGLVIDRLGFNEIWAQRGPMRGMYRRLQMMEKDRSPRHSRMRQQLNLE